MISLREAITPIATRPGKSVREHEILRISAVLLGANSEESTEAARKEVLAWATKRAGGTLPVEAWRLESYHHYFGGRNSLGVRIKNDKTDIWAIRSEDPDKKVPGRIWTTEVVIGLMGGQVPQFSCRLIVNTSEEILNIEPHSPGFIQQVAEKQGLQTGPIQLSVQPHIVDSDHEVDYLIELMLNPLRNIPLFVITGSDIQNENYIVDPYVLSRAVLGTAYVSILPSKYTWALTERFGKIRSVFNGAVRAYMPGFTESDDPYKHRLITPSGNTNEDAIKCMHWLRALAANESLKRTRLGSEVLTFSAIRNANLQRQQKELVDSGASEGVQLKLAQAQIDALSSQLEEAENYLTAFSEAQKSEEYRASVAEEQLRAANFRIQQLTTQIQEKGEGPDNNIELPNSWEDFSNWCDVNLAGRVILSPLARRGIKDAKYLNVHEAAKSLLWLANDCRDSILGRSDLITSEANVIDGVKNTHCGGDKFDFDWQGRRYTADWHIKSGGNTRDPNRCLRIYYCWDEVSQQYIVADMPAHRRTDAT